ncbi:MAG: M81 family metallopeptidase [Paracoccaceae bacterium]
MRIAIAGFQHETNTFVATPTGLSDFERADSWPALLTGQEVLKTTQGMNLPIAGFAQAAASEDLLPILWCSAEPGGKVTDHAFETLAAQITTTLAKLGQLDAVYLDLHGAMVSQSHDDGEGELLERIRSVIGPDILLIASLDLHANISQKMVDQSDALTIFRTYPHLDMADTGARAYRMLAAIRSHGRPQKTWRQGDYLIPLHKQQTIAGPAKALYDAVGKFDGSDTRLAELALGFTAADIRDVGPSIVAYGKNSTDANTIADALLDRLNRAERDFDGPLLSAAEAVRKARLAPNGRPIVIADIQDNPGAGASSDTTWLLKELLRQDAPPTLLGLIHDPSLAAKAHQLGTGALFDASIGGKSPDSSPLRTQVKVLHLSDGLCTYTGEMYRGGIATLGPSAALQVVGTEVQIVVTSIRNQCLDLAQFRHFDLEPEHASVICVKSTAHFRADFEPIAQEVILCAAPGQFPCRLSSAHYTNLRPGVRIIPDR